MYLLTLKGQGQNLTSGQGQGQGQGHQNRSCCISSEASRREKHNETNPASVSLFNQKLLAKTQKLLMTSVTSDDPSSDL